jgi:hypothetical protein
MKRVSGLALSPLTLLACLAAGCDQPVPPPPTAGGGAGATTNPAKLFNALDYGADPTGAADSTAPIQAAIQAAIKAGGGTVSLPPGSYRYTSPINLGQGSSATSVNLVGGGPNVTFLNWSGTGKGPTLLVDRQKYTRISGFRLRGNARAVAAGAVGIAFCSNGSGLNGTVSNGGVLEQVTCESWGTGVQFGGVSSGDNKPLASSEWLVNQLACFNCTTGVYCTNFNTQNLHFNLLQLALNKLGFYTDSAYSIHVRGASCSTNGGVGSRLGADGSGGDFYIHASGNFSIEGVRSELCSGIPVACVGTSASYLSVSLRDFYTSAGTGPEVVLLKNVFSVVMTNCRWMGPVLVATPAKGGTLLMHGGGVYDPRPGRFPFRPDSNNNLQQLRYGVYGVQKLASNGNVSGSFYTSRQGYYSNATTPVDAWTSP